MDGTIILQLVGRYPHASTKHLTHLVTVLYELCHVPMIEKEMPLVDAALRLGVSTQWVYQLIYLKKLPAIKRGRRPKWYIPVDAVEAYWKRIHQGEDHEEQKR